MSDWVFVGEHFGHIGRFLTRNQQQQLYWQKMEILTSNQKPYLTGINARYECMTLQVFLRGHR